ncbi:5-hydroxytryptamine receptor 7 isoform X1 [Corvus kubaryi]|nr:5-hydroxytryptamine receptor 7 isoform X1 [Corvus kubaryi]
MRVYIYRCIRIYIYAWGSQSALRLGRPQRRSRRRNRRPRLRGRGALHLQLRGQKGEGGGAVPMPSPVAFGKQPQAGAGDGRRWEGSGRRPRPPLCPRSGGDSAVPNPRPPGMRRGRARLPRGKLKAEPRGPLGRLRGGGRRRVPEEGPEHPGAGDSRRTGGGASWAAHATMVLALNGSHLYGNLRPLVLEDPRALSGGRMIAGSWPPRSLAKLGPSPPPSALPTASPLPANDSQCGEQILSYGNAEKVLIGAVLCLITLLTIAGNCLVVISVCFVKKLRQPSNYLIVSLALADLSVALAVMPFVSVTDLIGGEWIFGRLFCNVFIAMDVMCCTASIMTLCVISIDRYLGITRPLTYPVRQNGKCMAKMILCVWLLSASITIPPLFGWAQNVNDEKVCLISQDFGYTIYSTAVAFYIPMSVMLFMYYQIYKAARRSAAKHKFTGFPRLEEIEGISVNGVVKLHKESEECTNFSRLLKHDKKNISIFKREQKAATTLGIIVGAFTVCWLPFFLLSTARPFICGTACSCIPLWVERTFLWLGYANSLINPFIYAFFNRDLRTTYRNLLQCRYRNINRKLSAAGMHEALKLAEKPEFVLRSPDFSREKES